MECGTALAAAAAAPAEPAPEAAAPDAAAPVETPDHLADKIAASAPGLEGERKQVTVLFADVMGSMDLAESVDAEAWRSVMDRFLALIAEAVHRFEGTVNKFTGDGAMALFGAPIAHEDHASRACYAALHLTDELQRFAADIRREHGLSFAVRMGINSGDVVVGSVGDDLHMDYTAIGHTVGLAARMESLAEPGRAYLTEHTAALVRGYFELEELGRFDVKGVHEPVPVYALAGVGRARTRLDAARARGLSRFVGREEELAELEAALERARRGSLVIGVVAEPGAGKSRLCHEFTERCRARGLAVTEGRGVAHGKRVPLLPVLDMLRDYFDIEEGDDPRTARERIAGRLLLLDEELKEALPLLFDFLGIPDPGRPADLPAGEARQRQLFAAIRRLVQAAGSEGEPGVIVVEDLHWLDPGSDAFLENLVESLPGARTLVVVNFRPEYRATWMQKSYYQQMPLVPLGADAVAELVRDLLGSDPSLDGLSELVAERTAGNPFFVEEVVQGLIEGGALEGEHGAYRLTHSIDDLAIPPTVQAVLAARMDRLPEREKAVLQAAAVIGKDFSEPVLRRVAGLAEHDLADVLTALRDAEFVYERSMYPEAEYSFKHPLTEEMAYRSQLGERRARTHAAVARAIAEVYADRLDERAAILANHHEQAGDPLEAARWNSRAAWWAGQHHPADALRHWRRVRDLAAECEASQEADGLRLAAGLWVLQMGWRLGMEEEELRTVFEETRELAEAIGIGRAHAGVLVAGATAIGMRGNVVEAYELALEARRIAIEADDPQSLALSGPSYWLWLLGRLPEALEALEEGIELTAEDPNVGRDLTGFSPHIWARVMRGGVVLTELGRLDEAEAELAEAARLAREYDDIEGLGWALSSRVNMAWARAEPGDSLAQAREALGIADRLGNSFSRVLALQQVALAHIVREEWDEAISTMEEELATIEATRTGMQHRASTKLWLAEAELGRGDNERAGRLAREAVELCGAQGSRAWEAVSSVLLAAALVRGGGSAEEAGAALDRATAVAEACRMPAAVARAHAVRAELARREGNDAEADRELAAANRLYLEHGARGWPERIARQMRAPSATAT